MARHAVPSSPRRTLLRAGLTVTAAGAALGLGGAVAQAAAPAAAAPAASEDTEAGVVALRGLTGGLGHATAGGVAPVKSLKLNPLGGTGVDPLDNAVGTQVADFKPLSTALVTDSLTKGGGALQDLPLVGTATGLLPG